MRFLSLVVFDLLKLKPIVKEEVRWNDAAFRARPLLFPLRSARYGRTEGPSEDGENLPLLLRLSYGDNGLTAVLRESLPGAIICS